MLIKLPAFTYLLLLIGFSFLQCKEKTPSANSSFVAVLLAIGGATTSETSDTSNGESTTATVTASGGTVSSSDGSINLQIPAGALTDTRQITISTNSAPIGNVPEGYEIVTKILKFEPSGLVFQKPVTLTLNYDQKDMEEGGIEERTVRFFYIKNDSTLESMQRNSIDLANNKFVSEITHFSFGAGIRTRIKSVSLGIITSPTPVNNVSNQLISDLNNFSNYGYGSVSQFFQANHSTFIALLTQVVAILGYDPISTAFPNEDFDGDGNVNSEDPIIPSTGPQLSIVSTGSLLISQNANAINNSQFIWQSNKAGTYTIRSGGTNCTTGTSVATGSTHIGNQITFGPFSATSLNLGTNTFRICVISSNITGSALLTFTRDDSLPTASINPSAGSYGTIQNVSLECGDTGGAGCSKIAYTIDGSNPSFSNACNIGIGTLYSTPVQTPDSSITTIKYRSCDLAGNVSSVYSQSYTIDSILPTITINSVTPGTVIKGSISPQFNWVSNRDGNYTIKIGTNCTTGTQALGTNVSGTANSGSAITSSLSTGSQLSDGSKKINICVTNLVGAYGESSTTLTVDSVNPSVSVSPVSGMYGTQQTITATCSDALSGCQKVVYTTDGSDPNVDDTGTITNGTLYSGSLAALNLASVTYKFLARDLAGNTSSITSVTYTQPDTTPPTVSIQNVRNKGRIETGFLLGGSSDNEAVSKVEVSLDGGTYALATGTTSWKYKLPTGSNTWRDDSTHTISVRSEDSSGNVSLVTNISVRKGLNKDINGDGYCDLVIQGYTTEAGRLFIFHSSGTNGITQTGASAANNIISGLAPGNGLSFGFYMSIGDLNGDGYADIVSGESNYASNSGRLYIFYSTGTNGITVSSATSADAIIEGETGSEFGLIPAIGDLNGDGYGDIVTGAQRYNSNSGRVYIFYSPGSGNFSNINATAASQIIDANSTNNTLGASVATGDINGDGYSDLVVGAPSFSSASGRIYGFISSGSGGIATNTVNSGTSFVLDGEIANNALGFYVNTGDMNGDGYMDVISGSPTYDNSKGRAYVFHSNGSSGINSLGAASANSIITGEVNSGLLAYRNSVGDINGDGYTDLITGAYIVNKGYAFLSAGSSGITITSAANASTRLNCDTNTTFANTTGGFDLNGDGFYDMVVSEIGAPNGGAVQIFYSSGAGGVTATNKSGASRTISGDNLGNGFGRVAR
ncbi:MAG: FG-GAP-like repeat-containing protein [Leptospira sp.]|nr:FG-GAP-like repeat-containing protein [Leptospira sp.]